MITVYQIQGQNVPPLADARLYELLSGGGVGVVVGCEITSLGGLQLRVGSGWILIQGRWIAIAEETVTVTPSGSGQVDGQALLHIDVSNTESPGAWVFNAQTPLPAPVQEDINGSGTIYEMQMCNYKVDQLQVTDLQTTFPVLGTAAGYIYKGTFDVDGWTGSGSVSQTAALTPVDGGPPVTSASTLLACIGTDSTLPAETKDAMAGPASDIAGAEKTLGAGTISVTLDSAPDVDVELYFYIKQGVSPAVPPLDPVGLGGMDYLGVASGAGQSVMVDFKSGKYAAYLFFIRSAQSGGMWSWSTIRPTRIFTYSENVIVYFGGERQNGGYINVNTTAKKATLSIVHNSNGEVITSICALEVYGIKF